MIQEDEKKILEILRTMRPNEQVIITKKNDNCPHSFILNMKTLIRIERKNKKRLDLN